MKKIFAILAIISGLAFGWQVAQAQDVFACFPTLKRCLTYYSGLEACKSNISKFYKDATNLTCYTAETECKIACGEDGGGSGSGDPFYVCNVKSRKLEQHVKTGKDGDYSKGSGSQQDKLWQCNMLLGDDYPDGRAGSYQPTNTGTCRCYTEAENKSLNGACPETCQEGKGGIIVNSCTRSGYCTVVNGVYGNITECEADNPAVPGICTDRSVDKIGDECDRRCSAYFPPVTPPPGGGGGGGGGGNPPGGGGGGGGGTTPPADILVVCNTDKKCVKEEFSGGFAGCETKYGAGNCFYASQEDLCNKSCIPAQKTYKMWGCLADGCEELGEYADQVKCEDINKEKFLQAGGKCFTLEQKDACDKSCVDKTKTTKNILIIGNAQDKKSGWSFSSGRVYFKSEDAARYFPVDLPEFKKYKFTYIDIGNILNEFNYKRLLNYDTIISLAPHHVPIMAKDNIRRLFQAWIENNGGKFIRLTNGEQAVYNPVDLTFDNLVVERNFVKVKTGVEMKTPFGIVENNWLSSKVAGYNFINLEKMEYLTENESGLSAKIWPRNEGWCADMTHISEAGQYVQAYRYYGNGIIIYNGIGLGNDFSKETLAVKTDNFANNIVKIWSQALSLGWGDATKNMPCSVKIAKNEMPVPQVKTPISDLSFNYNFSRCPLQTSSTNTPDDDIKYNNKVKFCLNITEYDPAKQTKISFNIYPAGYPDKGSSQVQSVGSNGPYCATFDDQTFGDKEAKAVIYNNDEVIETSKIAFSIRQDQMGKTVNKCLVSSKK